MTEHDKWRHIVAPYLKGNGIELATGGDPIVPTSIQFELSEASYQRYNNGQPIRGPVHWRDDNAIWNLPFRDNVLDYVASSHLIEDYVDWGPMLKEWIRVLKPGGILLLCAPEKNRWNEAVKNGQCPNCNHKREPAIGEMTTELKKLGLIHITEGFTNCPDGDYNLMAVAEKP